MKAVLMTKKLSVIFRVRGDVLEHRKESDMATSSITANFVMSDPKVSRAFVRALLARGESEGQTLWRSLEI